VRAHVYPLDLVRFFAALSVVSFHLGYYGWASSASTVGTMWAGATAFPELLPMTWFGWIGVQIFFVISGFVIANSANGVSPIAFAKSRVLRLFPAVWLCAPVTLAAWLISGSETTKHLAGEFLRSVTLWIFGPWIDGVYWSLAVELIFYAVIFVLLLSGQFARLRLAAWGLLTLSVLYFTASLLLPNTMSHFGAPWWFVYNHADVLQLRYGCYFALGIWFWLSSARAMKPLDWLGIAIAVGVCATEIVAAASSFLPTHMREWTPIWWLAPEVIWLSAALLIFVVSRDPERFMPQAPAAREWFKHVGQMTYPLYLTHSVCGAFIVRNLVHAGANRWLALAAAVIFALCFAYFIARLGEPAVRKLLRGLWEKVEAAVRRTPRLAFLFKPGGSAAV